MSATGQPPPLEVAICTFSAAHYARAVLSLPTVTEFNNWLASYRVGKDTTIRVHNTGAIDALHAGALVTMAPPMADPGSLMGFWGICQANAEGFEPEAAIVRLRDWLYGRRDLVFPLKWTRSPLEYLGLALDIPISYSHSGLVLAGSIVLREPAKTLEERIAAALEWACLRDIQAERQVSVPVAVAPAGPPAQAPAGPGPASPVEAPAADATPAAAPAADAPSVEQLETLAQRLATDPDSPARRELLTALAQAYPDLLVTVEAPRPVIAVPDPNASATPASLEPAAVPDPRAPPLDEWSAAQAEMAQTMAHLATSGAAS